MDQRNKNVLWFLLSFVPSFGAYLAVHFSDPDGGYSGFPEFLFAMASIPVLLIAWWIARGLNRPLAQGFVCGLAAIFIFLFSFGGCGLIQIGR